MRYLIDSDVIVDWLNGGSEAIELLRVLAREGIGISAVSLGDVLEGIYFGKDPDRAQGVLDDFMAAVRVLPFDGATASIFARVRGNLRSQGRLIGDADILIAATAVQHDLSLVTRNVRHFGRIPGLRIHGMDAATP